MTLSFFEVDGKKEDLLPELVLPRQALLDHRPCSTTWTFLFTCFVRWTSGVATRRVLQQGEALGGRVQPGVHLDVPVVPEEGLREAPHLILVRADQEGKRWDAREARATWAPCPTGESERAREKSRESERLTSTPHPSVLSQLLDVHDLERAEDVRRGLHLGQGHCRLRPSGSRT